MPKISKEKEEKVQEQILHYLFGVFPKQVFTSKVAFEIARDEEFTKRLLFELEKKDLVVKINKNPEGYRYSQRLRWRISNKAYGVYAGHQNS